MSNGEKAIHHQIPDGEITGPERQWRLRFAVLVMLLTTLPYLIGFANQNEAWQFTGFVFGIEDGNSYIAKMLSGTAGAWFFRTPYTTAPQSGVLAYLPYILLGKLSSPPGQHEQLVVIFHLFRFGAGILVILATYDFMALFIKEVSVRRLAIVLATLGGGLGWIFVLTGKSTWLGSLPLEFYSPESFGFLALYGLPHLALARALLLWGLRGYLVDDIAKNRRAAWYSPLTIIRHPGLLWLVMGLLQPLTVVIGWVVLAAHLLAVGGVQLWQMVRLGEADRREWSKDARRASGMVLISAPIVIYTLAAFNSDPFLRQWTAQNIILSPHPLHYLVAYGLLLPFSILGAKRLIGRQGKRGWLLVSWFLCLPALAYAPYNLQRRLPEGIWVAIVVLAASFFEGCESKKESLLNRLRLGLYLGCISTVLLLVGGGLAVINPNEPAFRPGAEVVVFQYLADHANPGEAVLAAYNTGNALPAWAPVKVVIGHGPESVGLTEKREQVNRFYATGATDAERQAFIDSERLRYVFYGPHESALGDWDPLQAPYLNLIFQHGDYLLFKTR